MKRIVLTVIWLLTASLAHATAYTVRTSGCGANCFNTLQAASNAAVNAGDSVTVFAGTYTGWSQTHSGSAGNPITFKVNAGDVVTINGTINLNSTSFVTIGGGHPFTVLANTGGSVNTSTDWFEVTGGNVAYGNGASHLVIQGNWIHSTSGDCIAGRFDQLATFNQYLNNILEFCGNNGSLVNPPCGSAAWVSGDHNTVDGNTIRHDENGIEAEQSQFTVIRNNHFGPLPLGDISTSCNDHHPDTMQGALCDGMHNCGVVEIALNLLYEGNAVQDWGPTDSNSHVQNFSIGTDLGDGHFIERYDWIENLGTSAPVEDRYINFIYAYNISTSYTMTQPNANNNMGAETSVAGCTGACGSSHDVFLNIIASNALNRNTANNPPNSGSGWPIGTCGTNCAPFTENHNIYFQDGGPYTWPSGPIISSGCGGGSCGTWDASDKFNQDPLFVNKGCNGCAPPSTVDLHLSSTNSPAYQTGVHLTTATNSGSGSISLIVGDAGFFQDTWGNITGLQADCISIGTVTNHVCIAANGINYTTNAITLATPATWSNADKIWLYSKSDGVVVLTGSAPNIGAFGTNAVCVPAKLVMTAQPSNALLGISVGTITILVEDSNNNVCSNDNSTSITLAKNAAATWGVLTAPDLTKTDTNGTATWTDVTVTVSGGNGSIDAVAGGFSTTSNSIFICNPAQLVFTSQPAASAALGANLGTVIVKVEDPSNNVCTTWTTPITLMKDPNATWGTLVASNNDLTQSPTLGSVTWTDLSVTVMGGVGSIDATTGSLSVVSNSITIGTCVTPSKLVFVNPPSSANVGITLGQIQVAVEDAGGTVCTQSVNRIALSKHPNAPWGAGMCLTSTTGQSGLTVTAVNGVATWQNVFMLFASGSGSLDATDATDGLSGTQSINFTITAPSLRFSCPVLGGCFCP